MKKRILAILCVITLLASSFLSKLPGPKGSEVIAAEPTNTLTYITLADTVKGTDGGAQLYKPGFKNTFLSFYATVSGNGVRIHFGGTDAKSRQGFGLIFWGSTMEISNAGHSGNASEKLTYDKVTLNASDFGLTTFFNQRILYQFQTEFVALDGDGKEDDIRFTVYMNKKLATSITVKNEVAKLGNCIRVCDGTYKTSSYRDFALSEESKYERWTYSDVAGQNSATLNGAVETSTLSGSMDETYFQAKMTFPAGDFGQFFLGTGGYYGILFDNDTTNTNGIRVRIVSTDDSQKWGVTIGTLTEDLAGTLREKELNLGVSVKIFDAKNTQRAKLKVGIWLDGSLYNATYFETVETPLASYTKRVHTQGAKNIKIESVTDRGNIALPTDFTDYTLADTAPVFSSMNSNSGDVSGYLPGNSLDKVLYSTWIKYSKDSQQFHYAATATNSYAGISFYPSDGLTNLKIAKLSGSVPVVGTTISAQEAIGKETFKDQEFLLQLTTEYGDYDFDGTKDDLKFGVWFNGVLYRGQYFYYMDAVSHLGMRVTGNESGAPVFHSYYAEVPERVKQYENWTYADVCVKDQTMSDAWNYSPITKSTLDQTVFSGYTTFSGGSRSVLLGTKGGYDGFGFGSNNDGTISFGLFTNYALQKYITISPADYNMSTFLGNEVKLGIATRILKVNDDKTLLVEAIPMMNDQVAANRSWIFKFEAEQFVRNMALVGDFKVRSTDKTAAEEAMPSNLTTISLTDFGLDKELNGWRGEGTYAGTSLDDTKISFYVNFGKGLGRVRWAKPDTGEYSGFALYRDGNNLGIGSDYNGLFSKIRNTTITPESVGLTTFVDTEMKVDIITQYIDMDNDGEDDAKIGVYINNKLANGEYLYAFDITADLGLGFGVKTDNVLTISEKKSTTYTFYDALPEEVANYPTWTYRDVDVKDGVNTHTSDWYRTIITGASMDKTTFKGYTTFASSGQYALFGGTKNTYTGYGFVSNSDGTISFGLFSGSSLKPYITFSPADYGLGSFLGQKILLSVATRILSVNDDGTLSVEMFPMINNSFAEKRSCTMKINAGRFTRCMALIQAVEVESVEDVTTEEPMPDNLTPVTLEDLGLQKELHGWNGNGTYKEDSFDDTKVSFWVNFGDEQARIHWAQKDTGYTGFALYRSGENLVMGSDLSTVANSLYYRIWDTKITPESVGLSTFDNVEIKVDLVTQYMDLDYDGADDDVKIGVYLNNRLANGRYLYAFDAVEELGNGFGVNSGDVASLSDEKLNLYASYDALPSEVADYAKWTYKHVGLADGVNTHNDWNRTIITGASMDQTMFKGYATFTKAHQYVVFGGTKKAYYGYGFRSDTDGTVDFGLYNGSKFVKYLSFAPQDYGCDDTFFEKKITLSVATRILSINGDGTLTIEAFPMVNDTFVEKRSCTFDVQANRYTRCMALISEVEIESTTDEPTVEAMPEGLKEIQLKDFGLENELACWQGNGTYKGTSLDDTVLSFRVNFGEGQGRIHWAKKTEGYSGFALYRDGDNLVMGSDLSTIADSLYYLIGSSTITPESVGLTTFENVELEVSLVTQYLDLDYDGEDDDVKIGVYIEGQLANGIYLYALDAIEHLGRGFGVNTANVFTIASSDVNVKKVPKNLKNITLTDARIGIGSGNKSGTFVALDSLDGTLFSAKLKFNVNGSRMHLGLNNKSDNGYTGIGVRLEDDKLVIGNELGDHKEALSNMGLSHIVISPKVVGVGNTFVNKEFLLQMSIEYVDHDNDGKKNDIKLGVMINGKFFANTYFYIKNQASRLGTKINFSEGGPSSYAPYGDVIPNLGVKEYVELTARDFMLANKEFTKSSVYNIYDFNSLGGKAFTANVTFSKKNAGEYGMYLGGDSWYGLRTEVCANGKLRVSHIHQDGAQTVLAEIAPKEVGMKTFFGKKFKLRYTFDVVKGEKGFVNYRLGVYINGKKYNNSYLWMKHVEKETLTETIFLYTLTGGSIKLESVYPKVDFTMWGATKDNWKKVLG